MFQAHSTSATPITVPLFLESPARTLAMRLLAFPKNVIRDRTSSSSRCTKLLWIRSSHRDFRHRRTYMPRKFLSPLRRRRRTLPPD